MHRIVECQDCDYWEKRDDLSGQCRRNAPLFNSRQHDEPLRMWPITLVDDWCGAGRRTKHGISAVA